MLTHARGVQRRTEAGGAAWPVGPGGLLRLLVAVLLLPTLIASGAAAKTTLRLQDLLDEALRNSPEIQMFTAGAAAAGHRVPQATSLTDPMVMVGYQNDGFNSFSYPEMPDSQFMLSVSQMLPFPGKRALKGEMAEREAEGLQAAVAASRLSTVLRVKELYYDLFFSYINLDVIHDKTALFSRIEDAASARYGSGMGILQEVVMAQTEKYMLLEKQEMLRQRIASIEAMLCSAVGRQQCDASFGVPERPVAAQLPSTTEEALARAYEKSPLIVAKERMLAAADAKVKMAEKEFYPDFTITGTVAEKGSLDEDMWSITTTVNVPIYFETRQRPALFEAKAKLAEAGHDLAATKLMLAATIRDNYTMAQSAEKLMALYRDGLIPKTYQDFDLAMSGYVSGKAEALTVINRLKSLIDFELLYWTRFTERGKAIVRIEAATGGVEE